MTQHYSVVVEREDNGSFSAWVAGLPGVYAAADTAAVAKRAIRAALGTPQEPGEGRGGAAKRRSRRPATDSRGITDDVAAHSQAQHG